MITDQSINMARYKGISKNLDRGIDYLLNNALSELPVGKYEIDGEAVFVLIQSYEPKPLDEGKCEAHKSYIDIQYIIEGSELMGYAAVNDMTITESYDQDKDRLFVKWEGNLLSYKADTFAIFFPQDAHMPGISDGSCTLVKKAVVKVKI